MARRTTKRKLSKKETKALAKSEASESVAVESAPVKRRELVTVVVPPTITVAQLSTLSGRTASEIVKALLGNGMLATVNDSIDRETVEIIAEELDLLIRAEEPLEIHSHTNNSHIQATSRPPVVVVLGHVDHGKTTLLDTIRRSRVAAGESGGMTQHIGAYQVTVSADGQTETTRRITFIDTPGHEAFSAMRAHGVTMTDVAILVVSADDGVQPQTKEAISHAKAAEVPLVVAINKIDAPGANPDKVRGELAELGLAAEAWGGTTPTVLVSAKQGTGIDELLETVLLVADLADLKARPTGRAEGVVIEAHMEQGIGPVATVLVQAGLLTVGDPVVIGRVWGKVRLMQDDTGRRHRTAGPSTPVRVAGLRDVPSFGGLVRVVDSEREAKQLAQAAEQKPRRHRVLQLAHADDEETVPTLSVIIKTDVDGSLAAIQGTLESLSLDGVRIDVIHSGVGDLSESDVNLALASLHPHLIAFRTGATVAARNLARSKQLTINAYDIIYRLLDDVTARALQLVQPTTTNQEVGRLKVLQVFRTTKTAQIIGGRVEQGEVVLGGTLFVRRGSEIVGTGTIESLQRGQQKAKRVSEGDECGLGVSTTDSIEIDDVLVVSTTVTD
ncbi:translation initiation factor IF-2 [Candidatus Berkelbacteria bacterium]|nr:translation initiation factor IF-2 [Candidatus Berkelbacteria bacterium]